MNETPDLESALSALLDGKPGRSISVRCFVGRTLESLPENSRVLFQRAIDSDIPAVRVAEVLADNGITIAASNVSRHRRRGTPGGCRCPKESS